MDYVLSSIQENKSYVIGALVILFLFWEKIKSWLLSVKDKIKIPRLNLKNRYSVEEKDQAALRHLRDRAFESGESELMDLIKKVDNKFYDIHLGIKK